MDLAPFEWMQDGVSELAEPERATNTTDDGPPPLPPSPLELLMTARCSSYGAINPGAVRRDPALGRELIAAAGSEKIRSLAATQQAQVMWKQLADPERNEFVDLGAKACQRYLKHVGEFYTRRARQTEDEGDDFIERWYTNQLRTNAKQTVRRMMLPTPHHDVGSRRKASTATHPTQRSHAPAEPSTNVPAGEADLEVPIGHSSPRARAVRVATEPEGRRGLHARAYAHRGDMPGV
jgi:hypothetical protein